MRSVELDDRVGATLGHNSTHPRIVLVKTGNSMQPTSGNERPGIPGLPCSSNDCISPCQYLASLFAVFIGRPARLAETAGAHSYRYIYGLGWPGGRCGTTWSIYKHPFHGEGLN
jgi:hypothetical protein